MNDSSLYQQIYYIDVLCIRPEDDLLKLALRSLIIVSQSRFDSILMMHSRLLTVNESKVRLRVFNDVLSDILTPVVVAKKKTPAKNVSRTPIDA